MGASKKKGSGRFLIPVAVVAGLGAGVSRVYAAPTYSFTALTNVSSPDPADGVASMGGINNAGVVVGSTGNGNAGFSNGTAPLSTMGSTDGTSFGATAITGDGIAVGSGSFTGDSNQYAVYFNTSSGSDRMYKIGTSSGTVANAVAGSSTSFEAAGSVTDTTTRSFIWKSATNSFTVLDPESGNTGLGDTESSGQSTAQGLNSLNFVVGQANTAETTPAGFSTPTSFLHGYVYSPTTGKMYDIGTAAGGAANASNAVAINVHNTIVGQTDTASGNPEAFVFDGYTIPGADAGQSDQYVTGGTFQTLASVDPSTPESRATAINDSGTVVGDMGYDGTPDARGFVDFGGIVYDLNNPDVVPLPDGWVIQSADGINSAGDITGTATYAGNLYAYVLAPASSVPEPAMLGLAGLIGAFTLTRRRR